MDNRTEKLLRQDSLAETEKIFNNKHWSQFDKQEQAFSMVKFMFDNKIKEEHLKSVGDTYFNMTWSDFITLIESYGFIKGLRYDFIAPKHGYINEPDRIEEAILFYYPSKGLVLWATSFGNKDHINDGKVYGMAEYKDWETCYKALSGCSHGGSGEDNILHFDYDIREGLIHTLNKIDSNLKLLSKWQGRTPFMWFLDYAEEAKDEYDYKAITKSKIKRCPKELQDIIGLDRI